MPGLTLEQRVRARAIQILPTSLATKVPQYEYDGPLPRGNLGVLPSADDRQAKPRLHTDGFFEENAMNGLIESQAEKLAVHVLQTVPRTRATGKECLRPALDEQTGPDTVLDWHESENARAKRRRQMVAAAANGMTVT